jgi:hypothetical protein
MKRSANFMVGSGKETHKQLQTVSNILALSTRYYSLSAIKRVREIAFCRLSLI